MTLWKAVTRACDATLPFDELEALSRHPEPVVRVAMARLSQMPLGILASLAGDEDPEVAEIARESAWRKMNNAFDLEKKDPEATGRTVVPWLTLTDKDAEWAENCTDECRVIADFFGGPGRRTPAQRIRDIMEELPNLGRNASSHKSPPTT